jgi:hydroxymethylpyrimidine/phosphomethylpyrimidine kinase
VRPEHLTPVVLTVAGSDSGGGAGIQADLRAVHALGCHGASAVTCVTAQNLHGVFRVDPLSPEAVTAQMHAVFDGFPVTAVKTGMLFDRDIVRAAAQVLRDRSPRFLVVDPVMVAASGDPLLQADAIEAYRRDLVPHATVITPNLDEAGVLLGREVRDAAAMSAAARELGESLRTAVLLKGGHLPGDPVDVLYHDGKVTEWRGSRIERVSAHGSGCTLSAALAARLALGDGLEQACFNAREFLRSSLRAAIRVGEARLLGVPSRDREKPG